MPLNESFLIPARKNKRKVNENIVTHKAHTSTLLSIFVGLGILACGGGDDDNAGSGSGSGGAGASSGCAAKALTTASGAMQEARSDTTKWAALFTVTADDGATYLLDVGGYSHALQEDVAVGSHDLANARDSSPNTCGYCVLLYTCGSSGCGTFDDPDYVAWYHATEGTLVLDQVGAKGESFSGSIKNMKFIKKGTIESDCIEVANYAFSATVLDWYGKP